MRQPQKKSFAVVPDVPDAHAGSSEVLLSESQATRKNGARACPMPSAGKDKENAKDRCAESFSWGGLGEKGWRWQLGVGPVGKLGGRSRRSWASHGLPVPNGSWAARARTSAASAASASPCSPGCHWGRGRLGLGGPWGALKPAMRQAAESLVEVQGRNLRTLRVLWALNLSSQRWTASPALDHCTTGEG